MRNPTTLWIIHRDPRPRAALARIAGAGDDTILGGPSDSIFDSASPADVVLLAPSGDFESELEFVHRFSARLPSCNWVLLPESGDLAEAERLFDSLPASFLRFPPRPDQLRRSIQRAMHRRAADPLSRRRGRDLLAARFSRWFGDLDLPDLLRTLDPSLSHLPLLIRGEPGTGRGLMSRYIHAFGSSDGVGLRHVPCSGIENVQQLIALMDGVEGGGSRWRRTLWLEDVHLLPPALQSRVRDWVDYGLPEGSLRSSKLRWIATASDEPHFDDFDDWPEEEPRLSPSLCEALSGLSLRLPPLRERSECIGAFVRDTALAWAEMQAERPRRFSEATIEDLACYPWVGNMAELESVVQRTLAVTSADVLEPHHLRFADPGARVRAPLGVGAADRAGEPDRPEPLAPPMGSAAPSAEPSLRASEPARTPREAAPDAAEPLATPIEPKVPRFEGRLDREPTPRSETPPAPMPQPSMPLPSMPPPMEPAPTSQATLEDQALERLLEPLRDAAPQPVAASEPAEPIAQTTRAAPPSATASGETQEQPLQRLVGALAHEVRNPLVSIRTFSELLNENFDDPEFRERFSELVGNDVRRIESVVNRLQSLSELKSGKREPIDLVVLLDRLLDDRRDAIEERSLLVLKELDRTQPYVVGNPSQIEQALEGLIERSISMVPERGDVYIASKHNTEGLRGEPSVRVLIRYHNPNAPRPARGDFAESIRIEGVSEAESSLDLLIFEAIVRAQGGALTFDTTDAQETVIAVDLPGPTRS